MRDGSTGKKSRGSAWAALFISLAVTACVALGHVHGALGASRNDDWTYYRSAWQFAQDGFFQPDPYTMTMLVGQTVLAQPLVALAGTNLAAYQVAVAVLGGVGLFACYAVLRSFLPTAWSLLAVGCLAVGPIFGSISLTFMSDVPAFSLQALCLWAGLLSLDRDRGSSHAWLLATLVLGLLAFSVREYSIAAPAAVILVHVWRDRARLRALAPVLALGLGFVVCAAVLYLWRSSLGGNEGIGFRVPGASDIGRAVKAVFTLALFTFPAVVAVVGRLPAAFARRPVSVVAAIGGVLALGGYAWLRTDELLLRNYVTPTGSYPEALHGPGVQVIPHGLWIALSVLALLSAAVAAGLLVAHSGSPARSSLQDSTTTAAFLSGAFVVLTMAAIGVAHLIAAAPLFDRYLIPAVPFAAGVLLFLSLPERVTSFDKALAAVALTAWGVIGIHFVDTAATQDGLKWRAGEQLQAEGYAPDTIEAGLEWFGIHQEEPLRPMAPHAGQHLFWWGLFEDPEVCVLASTERPDDGALSAGQEPLLSLSAQSLFGTEYHLFVFPVPEWCRDKE